MRLGYYYTILDDLVTVLSLVQVECGGLLHQERQFTCKEVWVVGHVFIIVRVLVLINLGILPSCPDWWVTNVEMLLGWAQCPFELEGCWWGWAADHHLQTRVGNRRTWTRSQSRTWWCCPRWRWHCCPWWHGCGLLILLLVVWFEILFRHQAPCKWAHTSCNSPETIQWFARKAPTNEGTRPFPCRHPMTCTSQTAPCSHALADPCSLAGMRLP